MFISLTYYYIRILFLNLMSGVNKVDYGRGVPTDLSHLVSLLFTLSISRKHHKGKKVVLPETLWLIKLFSSARRSVSKMASCQYPFYLLLCPIPSPFNLLNQLVVWKTQQYMFVPAVCLRSTLRSWLH